MKLMKRLTIAVCALLLADVALQAQKKGSPGERSLGGKKAADKSPKPQAAEPEARHGELLNFSGTDTWDVHSCIPGKVETGKKGQSKNVPCGCIGMIHAVQKQHREECEKKGIGTQAWRDCMMATPPCSRIIQTGYGSYWGKERRSRCQTYCYHTRCQCCDDGMAWQRMERMHRLSLVAMVALKSHLQALPRSLACEEWRVAAYQPLSPSDLFFTAISLLN